jgi:OHCU decarboxylase
MKTKLSTLNGFSQAKFVAVCGPLFEHSPWIAERTWPSRPFASLKQLHARLCETMFAATESEQRALILAHPDLVGNMADSGQLTSASSDEQTAAGLTTLSGSEIAQFQAWNQQYRERFGFPFIICARENKKEAIQTAFPRRLAQAPEVEWRTALSEITKIARFRLLDAVEED